MTSWPPATAALRLRPFVIDDAARIMALNAEPSTGRWLPSHVYATLDEAVATVQVLIDCCIAPADPRLAPYVLALDTVPDARLIGHVGFSPLDGEVEVSYAVAEAERGHGHAATAVTLACDWLAARWGIVEVVALTARDNEPSRRLLDRTGFVHERDEVRAFQGEVATVSHYRRVATPTSG